MLNVVRVGEKGGFKFAVVSGTPADHASWWSFDDEQEVRDRHWHPKPGEVVLDIGAAFGSYTLPALVNGARVIAFSPADFDTELLTANLDLNPELSKRCMVVRDGLHRGDGWFDPDHCAFAANPVRDITDHDMGQWLRVRSLDSFIAERPGIKRVDWMKLDVEGAELDVLKGAVECLKKWKPKLLIELHKFHRPSIEMDVIEYLVKLGYTCDGPYPHCAVSHAYFEVR